MQAEIMDSCELRQFLDALGDGRVTLDEVAERIDRSPAASVHLLAALFLWFVTLLYLFVLGALAWLLRDGLGPMPSRVRV
jgi:hypothetical protein